MTAALIALTSPGPVLFVQRRVGLYKREFSIYKFRTMVMGAEQKLKKSSTLTKSRALYSKSTMIPRITAVGKFLRKTSIDELPQLINVLKGDMSLVGPRPLPIRDYEGFSEDWQRRRFSVRPGITCLWQISGRSSIPSSSGWNWIFNTSTNGRSGWTCRFDADHSRRAEGRRCGMMLSAMSAKAESSRDRK